MSDKAIDRMNLWDDHQRLMTLADGIDRFIKRYEPLISDERERDYFAREFLYVIQLAYREAQQPLVKQLSDVLALQNRPIVFGKDEL